MRSGAAPVLAVLCAAAVAATTSWAATGCSSFASETEPSGSDAGSDGGSDGSPGSDGAGGPVGPDGGPASEPRRIYVLGGEVPTADPDGGPSFTDSVVVAQQHPDGALVPWEETSPYSRVHGNAAVATAEALIVLGGELNSPFGAEASPLVSRAPFLGNGKIASWVTTRPLPDPLYFHAVVAVHDRIYVIGGNKPGAGAITNARFAPVAPDGVTGEWIETAALPAARTRLTAAADGAHIFVIGGRGTPGTCEGDVLVGTIGPGGDVAAWKPTGQTYAAESAAAAVFGKKLYVLGGFGCPGGTLARVQIADIHDDGTLSAFTPGVALPKPRAGLGAVILGQYLYAIGGNDGTTPVADVDIATLDAAGRFDTWRAGTALPGGRSLYGIAAH